MKSAWHIAIGCDVITSLFTSKQLHTQELSVLASHLVTPQTSEDNPAEVKNETPVSTILAITGSKFPRSDLVVYSSYIFKHSKSLVKGNM